ncbi:MAG TPA: iron ABC transporter permease [Stellaceae bacterium]|nr:iron ABC transporter permease [Stellaceae bacterium]
MTAPATALRTPPRRRRFRPIDGWSASLLALVLGLSALILTLLGIVLWLSFRDGDPGDPDAYYTLANYAGVLGDPFIWRVLGNTLGFSIVTLAISFLFGLPAAWLVERTDIPGKSAIYTVMTVGLLLPGFASAMGWLFLLHPRIGLVNTWLEAQLGLASAPFNIASLVGMGWVQGLNLAPVAFIMTAAVFRAMDPALEEAASMCGASARRIASRVTLPLAWPGILAAGIYVFTIGFAAFDVPAIIGWSNRLYTFSTYLLVLLQAEDSLPHYGAAAALSTVVIAIAGGFGWWYARLQKQAHRYQIVTGKGYRPQPVPLGWRVLWAWSFLGLYILLATVLPILLVVWASLLPYFQLPSGAAFASLSWAQFHSLPWALAFEGLRNTAILMVLTPTVTLACCIAFSWVVLRSNVPGRLGFDFVAFLPHAVPNIVFGVGALLFALFVLQRAVPIFGTIWLLLLVFTIARLSYGTRMTNASLIQIHRELEDSARMSGAGTGGVVRGVIVPLLAPTLIYAWLWIALLTFRELTLAVILTTRGNITLPVVVWSLWVNGVPGKAAALTLLLLATMVPFIVLYWLVVRRQTDVAR